MRAYKAPPPTSSRRAMIRMEDALTEKKLSAQMLFTSARTS